MTCDVWKEKECVVVDFDPAIRIKIISIRICHFMYYVDSNRVSLTSLTERNPCVLANVEESIPGNVCKPKTKTLSPVLQSQIKAINRVLIGLTYRQAMDAGDRILNTPMLASRAIEFIISCRDSHFITAC